jgi:hypothetical protein
MHELVGDELGGWRRRVVECLAERLGGTAGRWFAKLPERGGQIKLDTDPAMVKALRNWLESHELFAIIAAVLGVILLLSVVLLIGGYMVVTV